MREWEDKASKCTSISTSAKLGDSLTAAINEHYLFGYG